MFSIAAAFSEAKRLASSTMELQRTRGHSLSSSAAASPSALLDRIRDSVSAIVESARESRGDDGDRDKDDSLPWLLEEAFCLGARAGVVDGDGVQRLFGWTLIAEAYAGCV